MTLCIAALYAACVDRALPTEMAVPEDEAIEPVPSEAHGGGVLKERARIIDPTRLVLVSSSQQLDAGQYRFTGEVAAHDSIGRDDVIVVRVGGALQPRVVLSAAQSGAELILETGPAAWSDVFNSGRFGVSGELGGALDVIGDLPDVSADETLTVEPIGGRFDIDLCDLANRVLFEPICGSAMSKTVSWVTISGTLDSLALLDLDIQVSGSVVMEMGIDGGGVYGGTPPVFAPCNRGAYPGCTATPTGAALIEFLRTYAPAIPEASLPPVRVCVPGTPIRVRRGYWVYPGFPQPPRWVPPVYEKCRVSNIGELPAIVMPTIEYARTVVQPRVQGGATLHAEGDVKLRVQAPIPNVAVRKTVDKSGIFAEVSLGAFVAIDLALKNGAVAPRVTFDEEVRIRQEWTPATGWTSAFESIRSEQTTSLEDLDNPDSVVVRLSLPLLEIKSKVEAKGLSVPAGGGTPTDTTDFIGVNAGISYAPFAESVWSRPQIHPDDPGIDNWQISTDVAYEAKVGAGIGFGIIPKPENVTTEWDTTMVFGRASLSDMWGRGNLRVETVTTGADVDPDGYQVLVRRYDPSQLPLDGDAERIPEYDPEAFIEQGIAINDAVVFGATGGPCTVVYSEGVVRGAAMLVAPPPPPSPRQQLSLPKYALLYNCDELLIARHQVTLAGVADNCTVTGGATQSEVWLQQSRREFENTRSDTTLVTFEVTCAPAGPMGAVAVTAQYPTQPEPVPLLVDGETVGTIGRSETRVLAGLAAGTHTFRLGNIEFCISDPVDADIVADATVDVTLLIVCALPDPAPTSLIVRLQLDGDGPLASDLVLKREGVVAGLLSAATSTELTDLPESGTIVLQVGAIPGNCRVTTPNPKPVGPGTELVGTYCTSAPIDTLSGVVGTSLSPVPSAYLHSVDGTVQLAGPTQPDFMALAGMDVRVRGVPAGTSFDVYGYDILSDLNQPRHVGILVERGDGVWLMGESAIELVDAPPALVAAAGAFVWVGGAEAGVDQLRVTLFGVIREATP